jgi:hypothetical protein
MSTTTFIDGQSVIYASWLNDVNAAVYNGTFPNGVLSPTTLNATNVVTTNATITNLTVTNFAPTSINLPNNWVINTTASKIYFVYNGTNVASLDTSGNFIALGNATANTVIGNGSSPTP